MKPEAIIVGYSGHAYVVIDNLLLNNYKVIGYYEQENKIKNPYNLPYLGSEKNKDFAVEQRGRVLFLGIGDNMIRSKVFKSMIASRMLMPFIIHPRSQVSESVKIADGTVLMAGAVINAFSKIGYGVICNTSSVIEHECEIGDFVHIAPGAVLAGNVSVGDHTFIGANSIVKQGIRIGKNVTVGAGSVIVKDIKDGAVVYGNPGVLIS